LAEIFATARLKLLATVRLLSAASTALFNREVAGLVRLLSTAATTLFNLALALHKDSRHEINELACLAMEKYNQ